MKTRPATRLLLFVPMVALVCILRARADHVSGTLFETSGHVRDNLSNAVVGVAVVGDNYIGDSYPSTTDSNGFYKVSFPSEGNYRLTVDCVQLTALGYGCVGDVAVPQEADPITVDFTVPILNVSLQITNGSLPAGNVGVAYNVQLAAIGGQPPYHWQLATNSASLPPGLFLNSSGLLSGTPLTFNASNLKFEVTDVNTNSANKNLFLIINPKPVLTPLSRISNRFTMRLSGAPHQNYTVQMSANPAGTNWVPLFVTNSPDVGSFLVRDLNATNSARFYRILIGP